MNQYLVIAVLVSVLTICYAGMGPSDWENNEDVTKIKAKICSEKPEERPTPEQWTAYTNCNQNNDTGKPGHEKFVEKVFNFLEMRFKINK